MPKRKTKPNPPPRHVGGILVSEGAVERRQWAKRPRAGDTPSLFNAGTSSDHLGESKSASSAAADRSAACEQRTADAGGVLLFQSYGHCCDKSGSDGFPVETERLLRPEDVGEVVGQAYRVRPCRCRKWFCEWCGPRLGVQLRQRLLARLASFTGVYGITLTVDGSLFDSPEQAWLYVMENRVLGRFVRELDRGGHLQTRAYFWVVEFQTDTQQPHWHLLVDAEGVPFGAIVEIWSRFRPDSAEPLPERITAENYKGQAPAFGSVRYTFHRDKELAAFYATKYLTKHPEAGYPDWVLDRVGRMPRYGHSHRFFPRVSVHDPMCFCDECRGAVQPPGQKKAPKKPKDAQPASVARAQTSIRDRLEACGESCVIVQVKRVQLPDGTVIDGRGRFDGKLNLSFAEACEYLGLAPEGRWQLELTGEQATALEDFARPDDGEGEAA
jgi:hypothetical protein